MEKIKEVKTMNYAKLNGLSIIGEDIITDTLHLSELTGWSHKNIMAKWRKFLIDNDLLDLGNISYTPLTYIKSHNNAAYDYIQMSGDTATEFLATFTKDLGLIVIYKLIEKIRFMRELLRQKDKEATELVNKYRLTESSNCSNLSSICERFDLTIQKAHNTLVNEGVLKRFRNGSKIIYRLRADYLGKELCNIDQYSSDLTTHLKWTDKHGLAFLTEFFTIQKEKGILFQRQKQLALQPMIPGLEVVS